MTGKSRLYWVAAVSLVVVAAGGYWAGRHSGPAVLSQPAGASSLPVVAVSAVEAEADPRLGLPAQRAEFDRLNAVLIGAGELIDFHPQVLLEMARQATEGAELLFVFNDFEQLQRARQALGSIDSAASRVRLGVLPIDTMWMRDYGPLFVQLPGQEPMIVDADCSLAIEGDGPPDADNDFPRILAKASGNSVLSVPLRVQGGNFLTNGDGLLVSTTALRDENLHAGLPLETIEAALKRWFGVSEWITVEPLEGESIEHVDIFMTFVDVNVVLVGQYDPEDDPINAAILDAVAQKLAKVKTSAGPMQVHRIWMPPRGGEDLWRTYTNVIYADKTVYVPAYTGIDRALQADALDIFARLLPGWRVVAIPSDSMIPLGGALRCISMQVPLGMDLGHVFRSAQDLDEQQGPPEPAEDEQEDPFAT